MAASSTKDLNNAEWKGHINARMEQVEKRQDSFGTQLKDIYDQRDEQKQEQARVDERIKEMTDKVEKVEAVASANSRQLIKVMAIGGALLAVLQIGIAIASKVM